MQSLMGETPFGGAASLSAKQSASGGDPQDRTASPVPKLHRFYFPHTPHPVTPYPV
ncbi:MULTISPECIES: hypothetical protein [unclassified Moorena]|uniref:hypothetical protein n=1 Tax=unclassified Moorena TaxID=2683338 RepID=UPI0013FF19C5|nr:MULTISPECIES: hypothetical protein [unclassified Moorena]NEO16542.1 hypothetical protein [Moorena sp. SIO3E8]NEQ03072.1 hypothetical protein [Moorena sp. SIO3F7]